MAPRATAAAVLLAILACGSEDPRPAVAVGITSPTGVIHSNGPVTLQAVVEGSPDRVELLRSDALLAVLVPPYQYTWQTAGEAEGTYLLAVRARRGAEVVTSQPVQVVVDRTPPFALALFPAPGDQAACTGLPAAVTFSEEVVPRGFGSLSPLALWDGGMVLESAIGYPLVGAVTAQPLAPALAGRSVTARFSTALTDLAGNAFVPPPGWSWTYAASGLCLPAGAGPVQGAGYAFPVAPGLAVGPSGDVAVSWGALPLGGVMVRSFGPGALEPEVVPFAAATHALAYDAAGALTVLSAPGALRQRGPAGWAVIPAPSSLPAATMADGAALVAMPGGALLAAWRELDAVFAARFRIGAYAAGWLPGFSTLEALPSGLAPILAGGANAVVGLQVGPAGAQAAVWPVSSDASLGPALLPIPGELAALDGTGAPLAATVASGALTVREWSGTPVAWSQLGAAPVVPSGVISAAVARSTTSDVWVASNENGLSIRLRRWNGFTWSAPIGPIAPPPGFEIAELRLAMAKETPVIAWREHDSARGLSSVRVAAVNP